MDPVIIGRPFERLARHGWSAFLLLPHAVFLFCAVDEFLLEPLLLPVSIRLLLVGDLRLLKEFLFGIM